MCFNKFSVDMSLLSEFSESKEVNSKLLTFFGVGSLIFGV